MQPDYLPTASIQNLQLRAGIISRIRSFFQAKDFFHVETPILSHDIVIDRHLHPVWIEKGRVLQQSVAKENNSANAVRDTLFLQTSPEFHMKRLLTAGAKKIYQLARVFRAGESGSKHNPEFTMLEWYRVGDDLQSGMNLLAEFVSDILNRPKARKISYRELFQSEFGCDPVRSEIATLKLAAQNLGIAAEGFLDSEDARDDWLNLLMANLEPKLGKSQPLIVYDWPASQAALAKVRKDEHVAERFELYVDGIELANGYHELLDPDELRARNCQVNSERVNDGNRPLPEKSRLLDAMDAGLPACAGVALGVDRLVMIALGAESISDVLAFPFDRS